MHPNENINPLNWGILEPLFTALLEKGLTPQQIPEWIEKWSELEKTVWEIRAGFKRDRSRDETSDITQKAYQNFVEEIFIPYQSKSQALKTKLLGRANYGPEPEHVQMLRYLRAEADLYCQENVQLQANVNALSSEYNNKRWNLTVDIDGKALPLPQVEENAATKNQDVREWTCFSRCTFAGTARTFLEHGWTR